MTITLEEFKKFADENDIWWFYNKPLWRIIRGNSGRCYTKEQIDEIRKNYKDGELDALPYIGGNYLEALFGTPEEREIERIIFKPTKWQKELIKEFYNKKELQMCKSEDKRVQKHDVISELTENLSVAVRNLENLVDEVDGHGEEPRDKVKKAVEELGKDVSLAKFLDKYPKRIEALNERITVATSRLKELLF